MMQICNLCGKDLAAASPQSTHGAITGSICESCADQVSVAASDRDWLEAIDAPVLLMQGNPRQVVTANRRALELFAKDLHQIEGHRGGDVFDCVHSFTEAGCGRDANCEGCKIKDAIIDTFTTAKSNRASASLQVKKADGLRTYALQVSTEKVSDLALVRIDRYDQT